MGIFENVNGFSGKVKTPQDNIVRIVIKVLRKFRFVALNFLKADKYYCSANKQSSFH